MPRGRQTRACHRRSNDRLFAPLAHRWKKIHRESPDLLPRAKDATNLRARKHPGKLAHAQTLLAISSKRLLSLDPAYLLPYYNSRSTQQGNLMPTNCFSVIIAGGKGTRFWPLSRAGRPKQLLKILSRKSLIEETAERVYALGGRTHSLVVTIADQVAALRHE